jgi:hypothetical protein
MVNAQYPVSSNDNLQLGLVGSCELSAASSTENPQLSLGFKLVLLTSWMKEL